MPRRISTGKVRVCCEKSFHSLVKDIEVRLVLQSQSLQIDNEPGQITRRISHVVLVKIYDHSARAVKEYVSRHIAAMSRTELQRAQGRSYRFESLQQRGTLL